MGATSTTASPGVAKAVKIGKGTKFRAHIGDVHMALWEASTRAGKGLYLCTVIEAGDYKGSRNYFDVRQIRAALAYEAHVAKSRADQEAYFDGLSLGATVHYHNYGRAFVRCLVVADPAGKTTLRPVALVGDWSLSDLPMRRRGGEIALPYHAKKIAEGETWRCNFSCVFEHDTNAACWRGADPRTMPAIDLTPREV